MCLTMKMTVQWTLKMSDVLIESNWTVHSNRSQSHFKCVNRTIEYSLISLIYEDIKTLGSSPLTLFNSLTSFFFLCKRHCIKQCRVALWEIFILKYNPDMFLFLLMASNMSLPPSTKGLHTVCAYWVLKKFSYHSPVLL